MKRWWTILVVTAMALTTAPGAGAKPPPWAGGGGDGLEGGTACLESINVDSADVFTGEPIGPLGAGTHCVDVSGVVPGSWSVGYEVDQGSLRSLIVQVRDSVAPGDVCLDARFGKNDPMPSPIEFDVSAGDWVNACGTQFAEVIDGQDYWNEDPDHQSPLALLFWVDGSKDLAVTFDVNVPTP